MCLHLYKFSFELTQEIGDFENMMKIMEYDCKSITAAIQNIHQEWVMLLVAANFHASHHVILIPFHSFFYSRKNTLYHVTVY